MKRGANGDIFLKLIERVRRTIPGVAIRTSMIVGFPGETQADFEELCDFVKAARFDRLGVFSFSDEETSASFHLDGKVDRKTIYNRKRRLMSIQRKISRKANEALVGREMPILVEGPSPETELLWQGRFATQAPEIDGVCYINDFGPGTPRTGEMRTIRIEEALDYDLIGGLVDSPEREPRVADSVVHSAPNPFPILNANPGAHASIPRSHPAFRISSSPHA
jgi:ribosomal protein S12 methylthiotransferase